MKRILQVFGKLDRGGAETMIMNYYKGIDRKLFQFDFVVNFTEEGAYEKEILSMGGRIFRLPRFKGYNIFSYRKAWEIFLTQHKDWSIIHVHNFKIAGIILPIAKKHGISVRIVHMHIANANYSPLRKCGYYVTKFLANKFATHRLACGQKAGECYFGSRSFSVMNNAIDTKKFIFTPTVREVKREELSCSNNYVIGHVGRFNEQKNHDFIIEIFQKIHKKDNTALLLLLGIGELQGNIKKLVKSLGLEQAVLFLDSRPDVAELMMAMDVFLFPSLYEGLPVTVIEAQASGLPTVISNTISSEVCISDLVKVLSLESDAVKWADQVLSYKGKNNRSDMSHQISNAGYDINDNVKWLESFYANE